MELEQTEQAELHEALFHAMTTPMVAVDNAGSVVEWNRAAENYSGIPRSEAIGTPVWKIHARIAPARIPYEEALRLSHDQFDSVIMMSDHDAPHWLKEYEGEILSTRGESYHIRSEIFPIHLRDRLYIVGVISPSPGGDRYRSREELPETVAGA